MVASGNAERLRYERDGQQYQARDRADQPPGADWDIVVNGRRMPESRHEGNDGSPEEPTRPEPKREPDEEPGERTRDDRRASTDGRIEHVTTVELPRGQQIERRDEQPEPPRDSDGMNEHDVRRGADDDTGEEAREQRVAEDQSRRLRRRVDMRQP